MGQYQEKTQTNQKVFRCLGNSWESVYLTSFLINKWTDSSHMAQNLCVWNFACVNPNKTKREMQLSRNSCADWDHMNSNTGEKTPLVQSGPGHQKYILIYICVKWNLVVWLCFGCSLPFHERAAEPPPTTTTTTEQSRHQWQHNDTDEVTRSRKLGVGVKVGCTVACRGSSRLSRLKQFNYGTFDEFSQSYAKLTISCSYKLD